MTLFNVVPAGERELLQRGELPQQPGQQCGLPEDDEHCRSGSCRDETCYKLVFQKVASELHSKVRNHGEGPY